MDDVVSVEGPDWNLLVRSWRELGLGDFDVHEPGPGLIEIRISRMTSSAVTRETVRELLRGVLSDLAGRPVGLYEGPADDPSGGTIRFLVGSPDLLAQIGPDYEAGVDAAGLTSGGSS
jgi:hypothetical protein